MTSPSARVARRNGPIVIDLQAIQSPTTRARGIGQYALSYAHAIEAVDPEIVGRYLLNPRLAPPAGIDALLETGKIAFAGSTDAWPDTAEVLHVLSPLDTELLASELWPEEIATRGLVRSATVYDLIPALDPDGELADLTVRRKYGLLLEAVRTYDAIQTLASSVASDVATIVGHPRRGVQVVGAAPSPRFVPAASRADATADAVRRLSGFGLRGRYVFAPSGSHPRKNNERLVYAWATLTEVERRGRQLVIGGDIDGPTRAHYDFLATNGGAPGSVVSVGFLDDPVQLLAYQGADLVCVPSLSEGFGLNIAEAFACKAPVIASAIAPLDELVAPKGLFDPTRTASISAAIARALVDDVLRIELTVPVRRLDRWSDVAARAVGAFEELRLPRSRRVRPSARRRRPRVAFVSPLPPAPTGVANYSAQLAKAIAATEKVQLDVYADGPDARLAASTTTGVRSVHALRNIEGLLGRYDHIVITLGNSHHHLGALALLRARGGVVLAHDVRLSNLYRHEHGDPSLRPGGLGRAIRAQYGTALAPGLGDGGELSVGEIERYGVLMAREAVAASSLFLVTSQAAAALARLDAGPEYDGRVEVVPFALGAAEGSGGFVEDPRPAPEGIASPIASRWGTSPPGGDHTVIAHFGIVDPVKMPHLFLEAAARARRTVENLIVAFVGPISDELVRELSAMAMALGLEDAVTFTGPLSPERYASWLAATAVGVQLRATSNGEASAAVGECLAAGVPTVVSRLGWSLDLPDDAIVRLAVPHTASALAGEIVGLLRDPSRRRQLADAARRHAGERTFDRTARALLQLLEDRTPVMGEGVFRTERGARTDARRPA